MVTKKIIVISFTVFYLFSMKSYSQVEFISLNEFEIEHKNEPNLKYLEDKFDLLKVLILDSTKLDIFSEFDNGYREEYNHISKMMKPNEITVGYITEYYEITKALKNKERFLKCLFPENQWDAIKYYKIQYPIYYFKHKAVLELTTESSSDLYLITINKGVLQINWLTGWIE